jgi:SAM-dependent methyltransferase
VSRESWAGATAYEAFVGRLSRRVAPIFVASLALEPDRRWLDVGCGTGALTATILAGSAPASVTGVDPSPAFLEAARSTITDPRATFVEGSATALPVPDVAVDAAVAGLVLNFVGDVEAALAELRRVLVPGGTVGAYVWDYADRMEPIRRFFDAAIAVGAPGADEADEGARFPLCRPGPLGDAFRAAGFDDVAVEPIEVLADYPDFDAFWSPFLSGVGAAPKYLIGLEPVVQDRIREHLRATVAADPDGSIRLVARAWAVRGRAPDRSPDP